MTVTVTVTIEQLLEEKERLLVKRREYARRYREHPEVRAKALVACKKYYQDNKEKLLQQIKERQRALKDGVVTKGKGRKRIKVGAVEVGKV
jgi:hypothetical protein